MVYKKKDKPIIFRQKDTKDKKGQDMKGLEATLLRNLAIDAVKYQNFKSEIAAGKLSYPMALLTLKRYLNAGARYIKCGAKTYSTQELFYTYIDEALAQFVQPLTPSKYERGHRRKIDYTQKESRPPVSLLPEVNTPLIEKFVYGIKTPNGIRTFETENDMRLFAEGIMLANPEYQIVCGTVKFEEI